MWSVTCAAISTIMASAGTYGVCGDTSIVLVGFYASGLTGAVNVAPSRGRGFGRSSLLFCHGRGLSTTSIPSLCGGPKLGAGWCNAPCPVLRGARNNGGMVEILWHRRETRRKRRKQTSTCSTRRTWPTHQSWLCQGKNILLGLK